MVLHKRTQLHSLPHRNMIRFEKSMTVKPQQQA